MRPNFIAVVLDRWQFTVVVFLLLGALGVAAFLSISRTEDPTLDPPVFIVNAVLPGATPSDIELQLTKPIENSLYKLDNIREVRSQSRDGLSTTRIEFTWGTNPETSYEQVNREMSALRPTLPDGLRRLDVVRGRPLGVAVVQVALTSETLPMRHLEKIADKLRERLGAIPGVNEAKYWGTVPSEMRVGLDPIALAHHGVSATQVASIIGSAGAESPIGRVDAGARRFDVREGGAFKTAQAIAALPIVAQGGGTLRVRDLAAVGWAEAEPDHLTRFNGRRAVLVTVTQAKNEDVTRLTQRVSETLDSFEQRLPAGVHLERGFMQAENVKARLGLLARDFVIALGLVVVTLLPLGLRASLVVITAIPLSLLIGLAVLSHLGFTLNQLAISGFVVALGLLVDDAIVVVENIARWLREGHAPRQAAIRGTQQISLAVVGCTACLMLSFVPLLSLPEGPGEFIRSLPVTVLATIGGSLLVAMTLVPVIAAAVLKPHQSPEGNVLLRALTRAIHHLYAPVLHRALDRPRVALALLLLLACASGPIIARIGTSLFPPAETPQFLIRVETPQGSALHTTDAAVRAVEEVLRPLPQVKWFVSNVGRGNPQVYYNVGQREVDASFGEVAVGLHRWEPGRSERVLESIRARLDALPGARYSVVTFVNGPEIEAPVVLRISGPDLDRLADLASLAEQALVRTPGLRDVNNPLRRPNTVLRFAGDDTAIAAMGIAPGAIRRSLQIALTGDPVATLRDNDGDEYPVNVRLPMNGTNTTAALSMVYVPSAGGASLPLASLVHPVLESQAPRIDRIRRERTVTLSAYVAPGVLIGRATADALGNVQAALHLPPGYTLSQGGEAETQARSFAGFLPAILLSSFGILAVLVLEFGHLRTVMVVFGIVPFGLLGAVTALWMTGNSLSFTAMVGLIALIGIEIKNSILLVDFAEQLRAEGRSIREAVERAGELRFLPVVLTSVTAIGGLLPLALENNGLLSPTAITLIGGLVASTVLARLATPVMYLLIAPTAAKVTP